jgi:lysophospholipase L1-like esterase
MSLEFRGSRLAVSVWLLQLVFPAVGLYLVVKRLLGPMALGGYGLALLGLSLGWCVACLAALAIAPARRWIMSHPPQLCTAFVSAILGLIGVEVLCRLQILADQKEWRDRRADIEYSSELGWKLVPGRGGAGPHGWRGPVRAAAKPSGCYRIVCLGDSSTHGSKCLWEDAWPSQLEVLLNADPSWSARHGTTEVVNLGVPGYGTDQELIALRKYGLAFQPDLVILHICVNDFADNSFDHDWRMAEGVTRYKPCFALEAGRLIVKRADAPPPRYPAGQPIEPGSMGLYPALLTKVDRFLDRQGWGNLPANRKDIWPVHVDCQAEYGQARPLLWALVREIDRTARQAGSRFLVTLSPTTMKGPVDASPWRVGSFVREYQADAASSGVTAINCVAEYFAQGGNARFEAVHDVNHLNQQGNALVVRHTMQWLLEHVKASR